MDKQKEMIKIFEEHQYFAGETKLYERFKQKDKTKDDKVFGKRNNFQKDGQTITFSKSFRRLNHKTQVYSYTKGDHYRNRLVHTIDVETISKSICNYLQLNIDLVSAIALGHDIGHTPFGHAGERCLNEVLKYRYDENHKNKHNKIIKKNPKKSIKKNADVIFKHNLNAINILYDVEMNYKGEPPTFEWQTIDGIIKHTKLCYNQGNCTNSDCAKCALIKNVWNESNISKQNDIPFEIIFAKKFPITLEGQIVKIADEIAQRQHDIDDGVRDLNNAIDINEILQKIIDLDKETIIDEFIEKISDEVEKGKVKKKYNNDSYKISEAQLEKIKDRFKEIQTIEDSKIKMKNLADNVVAFLIRDVVVESIQNITEYNEIQKGNIIIDRDGNGSIYITEELIKFSPIGEKLNEILEDEVKSKILSSEFVNRFDSKSKYVIRKIFNAYYDTPLQLPTSVVNQLLELVEDDEEAKEKSIDKKLVICRENHNEQYCKIIAIYISGMTDNFAIEEYRNMYR